jgi:hypothetical protein
VDESKGFTVEDIVKCMNSEICVLLMYVMVICVLLSKWRPEQQCLFFLGAVMAFAAAYSLANKKNYGWTVVLLSVLCGLGLCLPYDLTKRADEIIAQSSKEFSCCPAASVCYKQYSDALAKKCAKPYDAKNKTVWSEYRKCMGTTLERKDANRTDPGN